ncbi:3'-5' exonuclease [candidate division KSB1 bacterium]|nr:3'-5' exonuclease [candidate division KSB1 bacterium]
MQKKRKTSDKPEASLQQSFDFGSQNSAHKFQLLRPLIFFDLETTGLDLHIDRIVQFAFIRISPDRKTEEWEELVNPGIPIPPEATRVHTISDEMVRDKPMFSYYAEQVLAFLQDCDLAGFNIIRFDLPFLSAELERCGLKLDLSHCRAIDMQTIFHKYEPRDLSAAYRFYCQKQLMGAHNALMDVRASVEILDGQMARYADLPREIAKLADFCAQTDEDQYVTQDRRFYWRHRKAIIAFGKHKGKSLEWVHKNDADYLRWLRDQDFPAETRAMLDSALQGIYPQRKK